jgi:predicted GIY-YIG superfamily endonuclease
LRDGNDYTFWVYILTSRTGTLHIGITGYIDSRISSRALTNAVNRTIRHPATRQVSGPGFSRAVRAQKSFFLAAAGFARSEAERDLTTPELKPNQM